MLSGDFAQLHQLRRTFRRIGGSSFKAGLARRLAAASKKLVADQFNQGVDPYGQTWAPLKEQRARQGKKKRADVVLVDTGLMKNGFSTVATERGFRIGTDRAYAAFHQFGTKNMPVRRLVPDAGRLPEAWSAKFRAETERYIQDAFKGIG